MDYKLIAVDMDGTLLDDKKIITPKNLEFISKAKNKGVKFVIASGRVPGGLRYYMDSVSKGQPVIACNGGVILDENKNMIWTKTMSTENALRVIKALEENGQPYFHFYDGDILCTERFEYATLSYYEFCTKIEKKYRLEIRIVPDAGEYISDGNKGIRKFVVMDKDIEFINRIKEKISLIDSIEITSSDRNNIEILERGINKGDGLRILAEHYNLKLEECIAIGNDENDISMIQKAGLGVAMKNAPEFVKEFAKYVTERDNNNDGIAEVIEKYVL